MGNLFKKKQDPQIQHLEETNIKELIDRAKRALDMIRIENDGTVIISAHVLDVTETISTEFQNLIHAIQMKKNGTDIDEAVIESPQKRTQNASTLKYKDDVTAEGASENTIPLASLQVAAVLGAIQNLPETLKTLNFWLGAIEHESDGSKMLNKHMLKDIEQALQVQFNSVHVEREDISVKLSESTVNTILQYCKENFEHKQNDMAKCESTSEVTTPEKGERNESNENHKLDSAIDQKNLPVGGRNILQFVVQVMDPSSSAATKSFIETLRLKLANDGIHIVLTNVSEFNDDSSNTNLVITICNNHSRLHVDMENSLSGITENCFKRLLLLVLHCTKKELLPSTPSKADVQGDKYIDNVFEIVDIGFEKNGGENGIYECAMNYQAFERIRDLVRNGKLVFKSDTLCKKQKTHE